GAGNLVVASYGGGAIYKVTPAGSVSLFASGFNGPSTVAYDANGNLYVPNLDGRVHKVTPAGSVSLFASGFNTPTGLAFDTAGDPNGTASDDTATVNTGDATLTSTANPSNVQVVASAGGGFDVKLSYTYADNFSNQTFGVVVTDHPSSASASTASFSVANVA